MEIYVIKKSKIATMEGLTKKHFLNPNAQRTNKSLGDLTGLQNIGFHIIEVPPGCESTEYHVHYHEEECTYILSGNGVVVIGGEETPISEGDFIGYRAGGKPHTMKNVGSTPLKCIVTGQRLNHDVGDYPNQKKRIYRNIGMAWDVVDIENIQTPKGAGKK